MKIRHGWPTCFALTFALAVAGCSGDTGAAGQDGTDGINGKDGVNGKDGAKGADGTDGKDGVNGKDGLNGTNGADGMDGMDGVDGIDGEDGDAGVDGMDGMDGAPGASGIIDRTKLTGKSVIYPLLAQQSSGVTGNVRFAEFVDGTTNGTLITIRVMGTLVPDTIRLAHVHYNDVATSGSPAITLNKVDGFTADGTGMSETLVTHVDATANPGATSTETFKAGVAITYTDLVGTGVAGTGFNGYVNVHAITSDGLTGQVAAGDIGSNF